MQSPQLYSRLLFPVYLCNTRLRFLIFRFIAQSIKITEQTYIANNYKKLESASVDDGFGHT